jgi:hypothetical protein
MVRRAIHICERIALCLKKGRGCIAVTSVYISEEGRKEESE